MTTSARDWKVEFIQVGIRLKAAEKRFLSGREGSINPELGHASLLHWGRHGAKWTPKEDLDLLLEFKDLNEQGVIASFTIASLGWKHGRSVGGIFSRLRKLLSFKELDALMFAIMTDDCHCVTRRRR